MMKTTRSSTSSLRVKDMVRGQLTSMLTFQTKASGCSSKVHGCKQSDEGKGDQC